MNRALAMKSHSSTHPLCKNNGRGEDYVEGSPMPGSRKGAEEYDIEEKSL